MARPERTFRPADLEEDAPPPYAATAPASDSTVPDPEQFTEYTTTADSLLPRHVVLRARYWIYAWIDDDDCGTSSTAVSALSGDIYGCWRTTTSPNSSNRITCSIHGDSFDINNSITTLFALSYA
ncbi:hypothetical protein BGX30_008470 [Mortierella sp. GBA39]|nr:hypothetical protein BGX30_008470 [Mortierella sp. GBA39]